MNENIQNFLGWQNWDLCKVVKKIPITRFIDANGEVWDAKATIGPCGCALETGENQFRFWLWCPEHVDLGFLVFGYKENGWFWVANKLEEVKK